MESAEFGLPKFFSLFPIIPEGFCGSLQGKPLVMLFLAGILTPTNIPEFGS